MMLKNVELHILFPTFEIDYYLYSLSRFLVYFGRRQDRPLSLVRKQNQRRIIVIIIVIIVIIIVIIVVITLTSAIKS